MVTPTAMDTLVTIYKRASCWALCKYKDCLSRCRDSHYKGAYLILMIEIPVLIRQHVYIETGPGMPGASLTNIIYLRSEEHG